MPFDSRDTRILPLLAALILSAYLLVYANSPQSIDGADTLDVASTWLLHGVPAATRLTTPRQLIEANATQEFYNLSPDGERYSKKGVTPSLALLPFVAASQIGPGLSTRATAMLLNPIVTLLTALQLYAFARRLKAEHVTAAALALLFAFATLAIVYIKTLFGEPLAALLLLAALYHIYAYGDDGSMRRAALAGAAIGLCIGVNFTYALLTVPLGLYILWQRRDVRAGLLYSLPIAAMLAFIGWWNWLRFGSPFDTGYALAQGVEGFTTPFAHGFTGLWLSLYKGVFWFQPILLAGVFGLRAAWRTQRALLLTAAALVLVHTATYASWWAWDGAWSWGSRFMVPVLPILMLAVLPALDAARRDRRILYALAALAAVSAVVQLPGVLNSYIPFYETVYDGQLFRWQNHAALAAFAGLFSSPPDPAVLSDGADFVHFGAVAVGTLLGGFAAWRLRGRRRVMAVALVLAGGCYGVAARQQAKPSYEFVREWERTLTGGAAYVQSFEFDARLLDIDHMRVIVTNPNAPQDNPLIRAQWERAKSLTRDLWLVTWHPPASPENWAERELWETRAFVEQQSIGGHRALHFDMGTPAEASCAVDVAFGPGIRFIAYGARTDTHGVYASFDWSPPEDVGAHTWFVHLIDSAGNIVRQQDRAPAGRSDLLFFPLPAETDATGFALRVGWVNTATGEQAAVTAADGTILETPFVVLPLRCER